MFSIIIVNFNTKDMLAKCLQSLEDNLPTSSREVIVIDNNSVDGSVEMLQKDWSGRARIILNDINVGFGRANNQGAAIAQGEYLIFLNSDCLIKDNILPQLESIFNNHKKLAAVTPFIVDQQGKVQERFFGKFPNVLNTIFGKFLKEKIESNNTLKYVDWISGASAVVKKEAFLSAGGFDVNYFMYFEDIDLCWNLKKLGYTVGVCPSDVVVFHKGGASLDKKSKLRKKYYYNSQDYFFKRHHGHLSLFVIKSFRFIYLLIKKIWGS